MCLSPLRPPLPPLAKGGRFVRVVHRRLTVRPLARRLLLPGREKNYRFSLHPPQSPAKSGDRKGCSCREKSTPQPPLQGGHFKNKTRELTPMSCETQPSKAPKKSPQFDTAPKESIPLILPHAHYIKKLPLVNPRKFFCLKNRAKNFSTLKGKGLTSGNFLMW